MGHQQSQRRGSWRRRRKSRIFYSPYFVIDMLTYLYSPVCKDPEFQIEFMLSLLEDTFP